MNDCGLLTEARGWGMSEALPEQLNRETTSVTPQLKYFEVVSFPLFAAFALFILKLSSYLCQLWPSLAIDKMSSI